MAITFDATLGTVSDTATLTTGAAAAAGSRVFVFVFFVESFGSCTGMSAGGGLTWVVDNSYQAGFDDSTTIAILSADAPAGLASSTNLTPSFSSAVDFGPGIAAHSWTGVQGGASGYKDAVSVAREGSASWFTNDVTTTVTNALVFGFSASDGSGNTASGSYTERHDWVTEGGNRCCVVSRVVTSAAAYTPGGTWAGSPSYEMNFGIAYKEGGAVEVPANVAAREFNGGRFGPF